MTALTRTNIKNHYIFELDFSQSEENVSNNNNQVDSKIVNLLILDNSGSMGSNSHHALNTFGTLFGANKNKELPGAIFVFDSQCQVFENIIDSNSVKNIRLPSQGSTNITLAFETTINYIENHQRRYAKDNTKIHYIVTFLSDGSHNEGASLNQQHIQKFKQVIDKHQVNLSIIVVGIGSSDTKLGMLIKTSLETVPMECLQSVYYARGFNEMNTVLTEIIDGTTKSLKTGNFKNLSVTNGTFLDNNKNTNKIFINNKEKVIICIKADDDKVPELFCEEVQIKAIDVAFDVSYVSLVINSLLPNLSRLKIAKGQDHIREQVKNLEYLINVSEELIASMSTSDIDLSTLKPNDRLKLFKFAKGRKLLLSEEKNKLQSLLVNINNSSAEQAKYLIGMQKKYASKAVITSQLLDVSLQDVIKEIVNLKPALLEAIDLDTRTCHQDSQNGSLLSLSTAMEHFTEWLNINELALDINCVYTLLIALGFTGYPVKFQLNNAVQMDPFQTRCEYIEPFLIDSSSLLLANQLEKTLTSPSRTVFSDILVLVDPSCPNTSKLLMKTYVHKYLSSVTLCKDLYMYKGSMMHSMYSHSLMKTLKTYAQNKSTAYLELALRIVYSFKKLYHVNEISTTLFNRWWDELGSITQSLTDNCNHPIQLLLLLTVFKVNDYDNYNLALVNLLNEVLARNLKTKFRDDTDMGTIMLIAQRIFKVYAKDSPKPGDDLSVEPRPSAIKETCDGWTDGIDVDEFEKAFNSRDVKEYLNNMFLPYVRMFEFIRIICKSGSEWMNELEQTGKFTNILIEQLPIINNITDVFSHLGTDTKENTILLQGMLYHKSGTRTNITDKRVLDNETLRDMIIDLRMEHYQIALRQRRSELIDYISNIPIEDILSWDLDEFIKKLGCHTHGLSRAEFWAYLQACAFNEEKEIAFLERSNSSVGTIMEKYKYRARGFGQSNNTVADLD